jgi:uncharacterized protein (DUF58 family)
MKIKPAKLIKRLLLILILLLFALFFPLRVVRYIAACTLGIVALSVLYSRISILFLYVFREIDIVRGHRQEPFTMEFFIENRSFFPVPYLTVRDTVGSLTVLDMGQFLIRLSPWDRQKLTYQVTSQRTGEFQIGPVEASGYDPLGLFPWRKTFKSNVRVIVYPRIYSLELINDQGLPAGSLRVNNKIYEDMTQFRSIREYVPGDEMKRINWKVTARMGKLYSTEFLPTLYFPLLIFLNLKADDYPMRHRDHLTEKAREVAASLIFYYVDLKQEVGLVTTGNLTNGDDMPSAETKAGYGHALNLLDIISRCRLSEGRADFNRALFQSGVKLSIGTRIMVISPSLREEQTSVLISAKRKSYDVEYFQIATTTEITLADRLAGNVKTFAVKDYGDDLI